MESWGTFQNVTANKEAGCLLCLRRSRRGRTLTGDMKSERATLTEMRPWIETVVHSTASNRVAEQGDPARESSREFPKDVDILEPIDSSCAGDTRTHKKSKRDTQMQTCDVG